MRQACRGVADSRSIHRRAVCSFVLLFREGLMKTMYFLRGLPASGKTTWALAKLDQLSSGSRIAAVRVNKDDIRKLVGASDGSREGEVRRYELHLVTNAARAGLDIIIDDTNLYAGAEKRFRSIAARFEYHFEVQDFLHVTVEECIRRDRMREDRVGEAVIRNLFKRHLSDGQPHAHSHIGRVLTFPTRTAADE